MQVSLLGMGEIQPVDNMSNNIVLIPVELKNERSKLMDAIRLWKNQPINETTSSVQQWLTDQSRLPSTITNRQSPSFSEPISFNGLVWVVILILPVVVILGMAVHYIQHYQDS